MTDNDLDVLIIGGGPSGLLLAAALRRHDVRLRIVDQDTGPTTATRAPVLWQRTQEILAALGLRDAWVPEADEMREESVHLYGQFAGALPVSAPESPFPKALYAGQDVTERVLHDHLEGAGVPVEYGCTATSYAETPSGAEVTVHHRDGRQEQVRASWVVSAEGSRSIVRHALGLDFTGEKYVGYRIHVADVHAHWTLATPVGQTFFYVEERGYFGGERLPGHPDRFYFYILTVDDDPDRSTHDLTLDEAQRLVRRFSGDDEATLSDPKWLNTARYRHGLARTYALGRAFLVGDAARSAPPLYGQGMNYGLHDAWNLAWKLGHVVRGLAPDALLETYSPERRKVGAELDARIDRTFRFITEPKPLQARVVKAVGPTLLRSEEVTRKFGERFTETAVGYQGVGLGEQRSSLGRLTAGDRMPAVWVKHLPDCTGGNLLDLFDGLRWTLLVVAPAGSDPQGARPVVDAALAAQEAYPGSLRAALLSQGPRRPEQSAIATLVDAECRFVREHHLPEQGVVLVRPDGYIGWAGERPDGALDAYLARWMTPAVPATEGAPPRS